MIIKSVSHKESKGKGKARKIQQLLTYIHDPNKMFDENNQSCVVKRYLSGYGDIENWTNQFVENDNFRTFQHAKRVIIRHEIVSFSPLSTPFISRDFLMDIAKEYLKRRTESPAIAVAHYELGKPIHFHCAIAAVGLDTKSTRITTKEFKEFKVEMEKYILNRYPDIHRTSFIEHNPDKDRPP
jgi:hypothetical protein